MKAVLRHLLRNRRRSILTLLAVLIPVYFLVFMFGFTNGVVSDLFTTATRIDTGHFQVRHVEKRGMGSARPLLQDADVWAAAVHEMEGVEWTTTRLDLPALASSGDRSQTVYVQGVIPEEVAPISNIENLILDGRYIRSDDHGAVIGQELSQLLSISVGSDLVLLGAHPETGVGVLKIPVVGIYDAPLSEMGKGLIQVPLETARQLARSPRAATAIVARVEGVTGVGDLGKIEAITAQLAGQLPESLEVVDWRELAPQVKSYMSILGPALTSVGVVFFGLGSLVVLNTLYLAVKERTRELGLIISLGASRGRVIRMFLMEAGVLAVLGSVWGALVGAGLILGIEALGGVPIPGEYGAFARAIGMSTELHLAIRWPQLLLAAATMSLVAILAAWLPAYQASKLEPVEAMRYVE